MTAQLVSTNYAAPKADPPPAPAPVAAPVVATQPQLDPNVLAALAALTSNPALMQLLTAAK
jgi:hypothetical protein